MDNRANRSWVNVLLFFLTLLTTTWVGARYVGINLLHEPGRFAVGLPYSIGLMAILGIHEMGHYVAARYHKIRVTPPYFIPVPFGLGTFGAFIQMKGPSDDRRSLFDVAVAGPFAGLVVAIPALIIGLQSSMVAPGIGSANDMNIPENTTVGSSILFALIAKISLHGNAYYWQSLRLSPLAFAGWLGFYVTALNLLPIGQLDGGHIARSMFGHRIGGIISTVAMYTLFLLAVFVWPGLFMWALIVFFIAGRPTPPLNDLTPITPLRQVLGFLAFLILAMIIAPVPHLMWNFSSFSPY